MNIEPSTKVSAVISYGGEKGEDSFEIHLEGADLGLEQASDYDWDWGRTQSKTTFTLTTGPYTVKRVDGLITKGAKALLQDKTEHSVSLKTVPGYNDLESAEQGKYRRKAKAVLKATGAL